MFEARLLTSQKLPHFPSCFHLQDSCLSPRLVMAKVNLMCPWPLDKPGGVSAFRNVDTLQTPTTDPPTHSLSLTLTHSHSLSLTLTHSHSLSLTLTHSHSLSLTLTHSHSLSLVHPQPTQPTNQRPTSQPAHQAGQPNKQTNKQVNKPPVVPCCAHTSCNRLKEAQSREVILIALQHVWGLKFSLGCLGRVTARQQARLQLLPPAAAPQKDKT